MLEPSLSIKLSVIIFVAMGSNSYYSAALSGNFVDLSSQLSASENVSSFPVDSTKLNWANLRRFHTLYHRLFQSLGQWGRSKNRAGDQQGLEKRRRTPSQPQRFFDRTRWLRAYNRPPNYDPPNWEKKKLTREFPHRFHSC